METPRGLTTTTEPELQASSSVPQNVPDQAESADVGKLAYRGVVACRAAGTTYRQLDYWARTGHVEPTIRGAAGCGTQRLYSFRDVVLLKVTKRLLDTGVSLQNIRVAVTSLRDRTVDELALITLLSDGATVYELHTSEEVADLLQGGAAVFGVALGPLITQIREQLDAVPAERAS